MNDIDKLEKEVEQGLPKQANKEIKRHYLLYIFGILLILVLVGYFAVTYAKDVKETRKNQDLVQQQINLQKQQIELQSKQIEDAKKVTPTPVATSANTTSKTTAPFAPTCDKTKQQEQIAVLTIEISEYQTATNKNNGFIQDSQVHLLLPEDYPGSHAGEQQRINELNNMNTDNNANAVLRQSDLEKVKACTLLSDAAIERMRSGCVACRTGIAAYR